MKKIIALVLGLLLFAAGLVFGQTVYGPSHTVMWDASVGYTDGSSYAVDDQVYYDVFLVLASEDREQYEDADPATHSPYEVDTDFVATIPDDQGYQIGVRTSVRHVDGIYEVSYIVWGPWVFVLTPPVVVEVTPPANIRIQ